MSKLKNYNILVWTLIVILIFTLIPQNIVRIKNENQNKNVVISLLYKDINSVLSKNDLDEYLDKFKEAGVTTVSVMEEDLYSLTSNGTITAIKYSDLKHKYDKQSIRLADILSDNENINSFSYVFMSGREEGKSLLAKWVPDKFTHEEYTSFYYDGLDIYCIYDGSANVWDFTLGYNENVIQYLKDKGFDIALVYKTRDYTKTDYIKEMDRLVKKYGIKYLTLKDNRRRATDEALARENYMGISNLIKENNMTLVVTENNTQLSNERPMGYNEIFGDNYKSVARAYETYDMQDDATGYLFRYYQYLNSTIDRNNMFISVTQIDADRKTAKEAADLTVKAVKTYADKIKSLGYNLEPINVDYSNYKVDITKSASISIAIMILMMTLMLNLLITKEYNRLVSLIGILVAGVSMPLSTIIPESLVYLYPTACAVILPCFAITVMLYFVKLVKEKTNLITLMASSSAVFLLTLCGGALMLGAMLSGIDFYVNNLIFKGIKISLIAPILFTAFAYYFIFIKKEDKTVIDDIKNAATAKISVYWMAIFVVFAAVAGIYLLRSGNVEKISSLEAFFRRTITETFAARPRTKEIILGYPCFVLFLYYIKKYDVKIISFVAAVGTSILAASISNSFCHVFTNLTTIFMRVLNGFAIGIIISMFVLIANEILVRLIKMVLKNKHC